VFHFAILDIVTNVMRNQRHVGLYRPTAALTKRSEQSTKPKSAKETKLDEYVNE